MRNRLAVLSTGRQDYGILRSTLMLLKSHPTIDLQLWAGGMHLDPRFGRTIDGILADGFRVAREVPFLDATKSQTDVTGTALTMVGRLLAEEKPAALFLVGDRTETLAAGVAAAVSGVPIVHLHGGEETEGAVDNAMRHALTKLSHLHLVSHPLHAARVIQMGEDPASVVIVGPPGLDNRFRTDLPDAQSIERKLGISLEAPVVLVTVHPTTLGGSELDEVEAVAAALESAAVTSVITLPNNDTGSEAIRTFWKRWAEKRPRTVVVEALGDAGYWALLQSASALIGNSSSGVIEGPAAGIPVVNVGDRQRGRLRAGRIWDVAPDKGAVRTALQAALAAGRQAEADGGYPSGAAAPRIVAALERWVPPDPPRKAFVMAGQPAGGEQRS